MGSVKEVALYHDTDALTRAFDNAGLGKLVREALEKQGYRVLVGDCRTAGADCRYRVTFSVSVSRDAVIHGTAYSFWHIRSDAVLNITFSQADAGPIFRTQYLGDGISEEEVVPIDGIPFTGASWGQGVEFIGSRDSAAIAAARNSLPSYFASHLDFQHDLTQFGERLRVWLPLQIDPKTTAWTF
jgi:hypothetical protein